MPDPLLKKLRALCRSLPETKETLTWGEPHFRVGEKIFCGYGEENGRPVIGFKLEKEHALAIVNVPGFRRAPYVGRFGWVSMDGSRALARWTEARKLILESYGLVAPKRLTASLDEPKKPPPARRTRRSARRRTATTPSSRRG